MPQIPINRKPSSVALRDILYERQRKILVQMTYTKMRPGLSRGAFLYIVVIVLGA